MILKDLSAQWNDLDIHHSQGSNLDHDDHDDDVIWSLDLTFFRLGFGTMMWIVFIPPFALRDAKRVTVQQTIFKPRKKC